LALGSLGDFSRKNRYSEAAIHRKTVKQLLFDLAEAHLQELERKGTPTEIEVTERD
jgi:hypothetical protein